MTSGLPFEAPTILMDYVAGRPQLAPRDLGDYLRQLAEALVALHQLPPDEFGFLPADFRPLVYDVFGQDPLPGR